MSNEVAHKISDSDTGKEGSVNISPNGLKIVPSFSSRQRITPQINNTLSDVALSGQYKDRFDDPTYYTA